MPSGRNPGIPHLTVETQICCCGSTTRKRLPRCDAGRQLLRYLAPPMGANVTLPDHGAQQLRQLTHERAAWRILAMRTGAGLAAVLAASDAWTRGYL